MVGGWALDQKLTWVGLKKNLCLPEDLLRPILGAVGASDQVLEVSIKLGFLRLAQFLLCELQGKQRGQP